MLYVCGSMAESDKFIVVDTDDYVEEEYYKGDLLRICKEQGIPIKGVDITTNEVIPYTDTVIDASISRLKLAGQLPSEASVMCSIWDERTAYGIKLPQGVVVDNIKLPLGCNIIQPLCIRGTLTAPVSVHTVCSHCFSNTSIKKAVFNGRLKKVGVGAFYDCAKLCEVDVKQGVNMLAVEVFYKCDNLKYVRGAIYNIGIGCFHGCTSLQEIDLSRVILIKDNAFEGCKSLSSVDLSKCAYIGPHAFYGCNRLRQIEFGESLGAIADNAFEACNSIERVIIPSNLAIKERVYNMFKGCEIVVTK